MINNKEFAEKFYWQWVDNNGTGWLNGIPDMVNILIEYGNLLNKLENLVDKNLEVFSINDIIDGRNAFIGCKLENNNFYYISVPCTIPLTKKELRLKKLEKIRLKN